MTKKIHKLVYLDHAATTPMALEVLKSMQPFFSEHFGNPSALYKEGQIANGALNDSRRSIAEVLRSQPDTVIFTSGGTEANNLALLGVARAHIKHGRHIITTATEHHSVFYPLEHLEREGWQITRLPVDKYGFVTPSDVLAALRPDTVLVSVMYANNEIGTVQPIADIGRQIFRYRKENKTIYPFFHTDACQAAGYLELDVEKLHVDLMTVNGGKIYGPKGVGFLYARRGVALEPLVYGGSQERGLRAGTENVAGIVGLAKAFELVQKTKNKKTGELTEYFWKKISKISKLNGPEIGDQRLPNNLNIVFSGVDGEALVIYLDSLGVACSTGSACTAVSRERSHVLAAIGKTEDEIFSSVRFTLGRQTNKKQIDYVVQSLIKSLKLLCKS